MSGWPRTRGGGSRYEATDKGGAGLSYYKDVTAGAANVKGAYAELIAATSFDALGFTLMIPGRSAVADFLLDIAIGATGSETIIIPDLLHSFAAGLDVTTCYVPVPLKAGVRLSARCQSSDAAPVTRVGILLHAGGMMHTPLLGCVTAYGANTGDSGGAGVDPGATLDTKGAYTEIVASLTNPIRWAIVAIGSRNNGVFATASDGLLDVAVGAAGVEQIILPDLALRSTAVGDYWGPCLTSLPLSVAAGQRLSARAQANTTDATDRLIDVAIYGID